MFDLPQGMTVQEAVAKAKARGTESAEPTEPETEAQDLLSSDDEQDPQEETEESSNDELLETEESEGEEFESEETQDAESDETGDDLFYDLDGEEVSESQLREWKAEGMKAADYTRKTQELAKQRKDFEAKQAEFLEKQKKLDATLAEVEAIVQDETFTDEQLQEMREYEPDKYIDYIEKKDKREKLINSAKANKASPENFQEEYIKFAQANDGWFSEDGKPTEKAKEQVKLMSEYGESLGMTDADIQSMNSKTLKVYLDAARYSKMQKSSDPIKKRVRKAPPVTKPRAQGLQSSLDKQIADAQAKFKRTGDFKDAVTLRKLKAKAQQNRP